LTEASSDSEKTRSCVGWRINIDDGNGAHRSRLGFRVLVGFVTSDLEEVRWGRWRTDEVVVAPCRQRATGRAVMDRGPTETMEVGRRDEEGRRGRKTVTWEEDGAL
jgi:hypothetical protein